MSQSFCEEKAIKVIQNFSRSFLHISLMYCEAGRYMYETNLTFFGLFQTSFMGLQSLFILLFDSISKLPKKRETLKLTYNENIER